MRALVRAFLSIVVLLLGVSISRGDDRSVCLAGGGDAGRAVAACTRLIDKRSLNSHDLSVVYNQRGLGHERLGAHENALADLNEAIRLDPRSAIAFNNRSWTYSNVGDYDRAIADASEAIRLNRAYVTAYVNRGTGYERKGEFQQAIGDYTKAIDLNPKFAAAYNNRGVCHDKLGDYDGAIRDFDKAIRLNPREAATYFNRAVTYEKRDDLNKALANYRAVVGLNPDDQAAAAAVRQIEHKLQERSGSDLAIVVPPPSPSVPDKPAAAPPVDLGRRVALVIGNSHYKSVPKLPNPTHDANAIAELFRKAGFAVVQSRQDLDLQSLRGAIREFYETALDSDVAVVYFAGHGMEVNGTNYLIPIDARFERDTDVEDEAVPLDRVLQLLEPARRLRLVILDACRDSAFVTTMKRTLATRYWKRPRTRGADNVRYIDCIRCQSRLDGGRRAGS